MFNNLKRKFLVIAMIIGSLSMFSIPQNVSAGLTNNISQLLVVGLVLTLLWELVTMELKLLHELCQYERWC